MNLTENKQKYSKGDIIMRQGDEGDSAYIVEKGHVEIVIEKDNGLVQSLGTRGEGALIGEMAIIDDKPRTATVKALEDCELLEITKSDFERRMQASDPIIQMIAQVVLARYRDTIKRAHIIGNRDFPTPEDLEKSYIQQNNAVESLKIENEFKKALKEDQLLLYYQPIIDLKTSEIIGFESLMRWNHPEKGFLPPDLFIPIIEQSGLIVEASRWVLSQSCKTLAKIQETFEDNGKLFVSVNFSSVDISDSGFQQHFNAALHENNLTPKQIHIEITERLLMDQPDIAQETLQKCRDLGASVSIDDFGTGYSSLSYLHHFPINVLKIDRSFITNVEDKASSRELVKSIIALGQNMGMKIIAEGIEKEEQKQILKDMGCDAAQGYFIAKPLPEQDLFAFLS